MTPRPTFTPTGDPDADALLVEDPFALVLGMLLDQQIPIEWAFMGPYRLRQRIGDQFSAPGIAAMDPDQLSGAFSEKPALHRYPAAMARRTQELAAHVVDHHEGDVARVWRGARSGERVYERLRDLPGFGEEKAQIFLAVLAKRFHKRPSGWETCAGPFADDLPRTVADIGDAEGLAAVREWKKAQKQAGRSKSD